MLMCFNYQCLCSDRFRFKTVQNRMPQPIEKLNRVIKAMKGGNGGNVPENRPGSQYTLTDHKTRWKLAWMNVYDELRMEMGELRRENDRVNGLLVVEREKNAEKTTRVTFLKNQLREEWERSDRKSEKIQKLKRNLDKKPTVDATTQVEECFADAVTQVEKCCDDAATQTDKLKIEKRIKLTDSEIKDEEEEEMMKKKVTMEADVKEQGHGKLIDMKIEGEVKTMRFNCPDCGFATNKKSTWDDHSNETCKYVNPVKNVQCKMCNKWKTRRALRLHLNNFLTGLHKPRGSHARYSLKEHQEYRKELDN